MAGGCNLWAGSRLLDLGLEAGLVWEALKGLGPERVWEALGGRQAGLSLGVLGGRALRTWSRN